MTIPATLITERQLERQASELLQTIGLTQVDKQLPIGNYKIDAVAKEEKTGKFYAVELKTCAHIGSLGQLLLYRSALKKTLDKYSPGRNLEVAGLLITTFLDREVVDVVDQLGLKQEILIKVCVDNGTSYTLVDPDAACEQAWYQMGSSSDWPQCRILKWLHS